MARRARQKTGAASAGSGHGTSVTVARIAATGVIASALITGAFQLAGQLLESSPLPGSGQVCGR
jgi:hypothetical protein